MCSIFKGLFRTGVIATVLVGVVAGGTLLIAGRSRAKAVFHKVHEQVLNRIDHHIDEPTALRTQLEEMSREYPKRTAQVRSDLASLNEQIRQVEREKAISARVVELTGDELAQLEPRVAEVAAMRAGSGELRRSVVSVEDRVYSYDLATRHLNQTRATHDAYLDRRASAEHDLVYLKQQSGRLEELLISLENEQAQFQSQLMQLNRQVDAIERNERLIGLLEKRNKTIEELSRFESVSLEQLTDRLAQVQSGQEAQLDMLSSSDKELSYEDIARRQLEQENRDYPAVAGPDHALDMR